MQTPDVLALHISQNKRTPELVRTLTAGLHSSSLEPDKDLLPCLCWGSITGRLISMHQDFLSMLTVIALNRQRGFSKLLFQNIKEGI